MIFYLIFCSVLTAAFAQEPSLTCNYFNYGETYLCNLVINNPDGLNNFTEISGIHLEGFTNDDLNLINVFSGLSTNIPSILCETFPNIVRFDFDNTGLTEIDDSAFSGCSRITELILYRNRIRSVSANAFVNLHDLKTLYLDSNLLTTLPENVFANQQNLIGLYLGSNLFNDLPVNLFRPLENLEAAFLGYANLTAINTQWFTTNARLQFLYLAGNRIAISADSLVGMEGLTSLNLANNGISEIPAGTFAQLPNLLNLYLSSNDFTQIHPDSFADLGNLLTLEINNNPIVIIHNGAFQELVSLTSLSMSNCRIRQLNPNSFENLGRLTEINLNFNDIEELPQGLFVPSPNLSYIALWNNRLKTLRRNRFGTLTSLQTLDLDSNVMNALDREIIDDAVNLNTLYFNGNLCANNYFGNFLISRPQHLPVLETCFSNMRYIIETTTEGDDDFTFFDGPQTGIALRVNSDNEVQIALTPFSFVWNPNIEIFIGTKNNTRSTIRINQETNVVTVPSPNILARDQWNDFRITWEDQVILVFSGNNTFPFMAYTMQHFFPVNFYGLRAVETRALWTVQPFYW